jgi:hypothetical protein
MQGRQGKAAKFTARGGLELSPEVFTDQRLISSPPRKAAKSVHGRW